MLWNLKSVFAELARRNIERLALDHSFMTAPPGLPALESQQSLVCLFVDDLYMLRAPVAENEPARGKKGGFLLRSPKLGKQHGSVSAYSAYPDILTLERGLKTARHEIGVSQGHAEVARDLVRGAWHSSQRLGGRAGEPNYEDYLAQQLAMQALLLEISTSQARAAAKTAAESGPTDRLARTNPPKAVAQQGRIRRLMRLARGELRSRDTHLYAMLNAVGEEVDVISEAIRIVRERFTHGLEKPEPALDVTRKTKRATNRRNNMIKDELPEIITGLKQILPEPFASIAQAACPHLELGAAALKLAVEDKPAHAKHVLEARQHLTRAANILGRADIVVDLNSLRLAVSLACDPRFAKVTTKSDLEKLGQAVDHFRRSLGKVGVAWSTNGEEIVPYHANEWLVRASTALAGGNTLRAKECLAKANNYFVG